jgi:hypothetical protein
VDKSTKFWPKTQISQNFATPPNFGTLIEIKLTKYAERIASDDRMEKVSQIAELRQRLSTDQGQQMR